MKVLIRAAVVAGLAAVAWPLLAQNTKSQNDSAKDQSRESRDNSSGRAFLGVSVSPLPPALGSHMKEQIASGQGLLVEDVADDSAADKGGIKEDDILLCFDDQKLFSPEQLARLVQSDKPGREVTFELLRSGKREKVQVKLGERPSDAVRGWTERPANSTGQHGSERRFSRRPNVGDPAGESAWEDFDSLSLKKINKDKFRAEVQYLDKENKTRKHVFEGTREEIRKDIQSQKDLKPEERAQLLRSLGLASSDQFPFGGFGFPPGMGWFLEPDNQYD
jgi:hypothetical protein